MFHGCSADLGFRSYPPKGYKGFTRARCAQVGYLQKTTLWPKQQRQQPPLALLQVVQP